MATMTTSARAERGWQRPEAERLLTGATVVTFVRTVASVGVALYAAYDRSLTLLLVALAVYWVGDMADGALARLTDTETRIGAVFDIVSDRLCAGAFYVGLVWLEPAMALPVGIFLLEFAVVDTFVSLAFLAWPLRSPNYFHLVDRPIWLANWSKPGKAANSSAVALLMVFTHSVLLCTAVALGLLAVKVWSLVRLNRLGLPLPQTAGRPNPAAHAQAAPTEQAEQPGQAA
ncbi:CDP-alcohol phosphatidyltransferase family protein [Actinopolymorpha singaporensis]|uniref:CDP-diacylglycerol--glycerol-3-phosphate 3-phosphatidyltransferase n=1 Tax=Actinopolymorpha singaporensis TaxID=117157 RepID=A0A1H1NVB2_9ACTN|nr:CDP-alcohol phosphatidyltransferase family protein [Actinopolymorpha singaporensis]SDS02735.1 CDP-diacylglycerol--glycerol-3-phosphate 3-phosphatidyltransferase [Actinopolymorpha singaporensis]